MCPIPMQGHIRSILVRRTNQPLQVHFHHQPGANFPNYLRGLPFHFADQEQDFNMLFNIHPFPNLSRVVQLVLRARLRQQHFQNQVNVVQDHDAPPIHDDDPAPENAPLVPIQHMNHPNVENLEEENEIMQNQHDNDGDTVVSSEAEGTDADLISEVEDEELPPLNWGDNNNETDSDSSSVFSDSDMPLLDPLPYDWYDNQIAAEEDGTMSDNESTLETPNTNDNIGLNFAPRLGRGQYLNACKAYLQSNNFQVPSDVTLHRYLEALPQASSFTENESHFWDLIIVLVFSMLCLLYLFLGIEFYLETKTE